MASVWKLRAKYATVRPTGWRSNPSAAAQWRWDHQGITISVHCRLWGPSNRWIENKKLELSGQDLRRHAEQPHIRRGQKFSGHHMLQG